MVVRVGSIAWSVVAFGLGVATACGGSSTTTNGAGSGQGATAGVSTTTGSGGTSTGAGASGGASAAGGTGATGSGATGSGATGSGATGSGAFGGSGASGGATGAGAGETCGPGGCIPGTDAGAIEPPGPVLCGGVECGASEACCIETHECFDPQADPDACTRPPPDDDLWGRTPCSSNAHCGAMEYCALDSGLCQGPGHCHPIGNCGSCSGGDACRVCGCDGNTYPDQQTACLARTNVVSARGGCGETMMEGAGGSGGTIRTITPCATTENCPGGELCCTITGRCFPEADPGQCALPPEGTTFPCTSNAQCWDHEYCAGDGCEGPGGCTSKSRHEENCGVTLEPVCGCDGTTYTSADCSLSRGVRIAHDGECDTAE